MKTPCEIIVVRILPHIRAMVAIDLKDNYHLKGKEIARLVGTTEAAVSQYLHGTRGVNPSFFRQFPEIPAFAAEAARELYEKRDTDIELTEKLGEICIRLRKNKTYIDMYSEGKQSAVCGICFQEVE